MGTLGNLLWFLLIGLGSAIGWCMTGLIWCITIIGIPFGKQAFKIARLVLAPFGKTINTNFNAHPIANVLWILFGGLGLALGYAFTGFILCITIIGIPFGKQCFKLASLALTPFGASIT